MKPLVAYYAAVAKVVLDRLDEALRRKVRAAVRRLVAEPTAGFWIRESEGMTLRMLPVDGWRLFYIVWEAELVVTEILPASQAPTFPV